MLENRAYLTRHVLVSSAGDCSVCGLNSRCLNLLGGAVDCACLVGFYSPSGTHRDCIGESARNGGKGRWLRRGDLALIGSDPWRGPKSMKQAKRVKTTVVVGLLHHLEIFEVVCWALQGDPAAGVENTSIDSSLYPKGSPLGSAK